VPRRLIVASTYGTKARVSKTVEKIYKASLACGASEREILLMLIMSETDLRSYALLQISEAILRVREGRYKIYPGYDGVSRELQIFEERKLRR
jgi:hypothetical protein